MKLEVNDVKKRLFSFQENIIIIPNNVVTHSDFLKEISNDEFIKVFSQYQHLIKSIYTDMSKNLIDYGVSTMRDLEEKLYDEFTSPLFYLDRLLQVHHLIYKLCCSSNLMNDTLLVNLEKFYELLNILPKIKNPDLVIKKLITYGFLFEGFDGKIKKSQSLLVKHKIANLITVVKNFSESHYTTTSFEFDYAHMNYELLLIGKNNYLDLKKSLVYRLLNEDSKNFLSNFDQNMRKIGYSYGAGATSGLCWGISQYAYSKNPEKKTNYVARLYQRKDRLVIRLFLKNVGSYADYIEKSPEYIKDAFINDFGNCNRCKENCSHRKTYVINNKEYNKCDGLTFEFFNLSLEAIPHYLNLINLSSSKKV